MFIPGHNLSSDSVIRVVETPSPRFLPSSVYIQVDQTGLFAKRTVRSSLVSGTRDHDCAICKLSRLAIAQLTRSLLNDAVSSFTVSRALSMQGICPAAVIFLIPGRVEKLLQYQKQSIIHAHDVIFNDSRCCCCCNVSYRLRNLVWCIESRR